MELNYKKWGIHFDIAGAKSKVEELEKQSAEPDFWNDMSNSQKILQLTKNLKDKIGKYENLIKEYQNLIELIDLGNEEDDNSILYEVRQDSKKFIDAYNELKISTLLDGEYDKNNAILTLHSGAGGTEACDWVEMLLRMYTRWAEKRGYKIEELDYLAGEEAGIKSVTIQITGENAYGYIKSEKGVHRLVRISPFDSSGRRHTSFASCDVMPEIGDDIDLDINSDDLKIDTYRSSGAGGQHVNKTESAIRITHTPTGIVVQCQNERSQHKNKDTAMKMLKSKLFELKQEQQLEKLQNIRGEVKDISWGSQIRSYVFTPYTLVKDHRTNEEAGNIQSVMDGNIDTFINAYLSWIH